MKEFIVIFRYNFFLKCTTFDVFTGMGPYAMVVS